jgi:TetR/AcrR family transcriptional repressor of tetCD
MEKPSRRQTYVETTREAILASAHQLFCRRHFDGTSLDAIATEANVTKGAIYHHFKDKRAVFSTCFERQAREVTNAIAAAPAGADEWQSALNECRAFLDFVVAQGAQTLSLQEVITVLGWEQWRRIDTHHTIGHIERMVERLQTTGQMKPYPASLVVSMIFGLLVEAAMNLNSHGDLKQTYTNLNNMIRDMLFGLKA